MVTSVTKEQQEQVMQRILSDPAYKGKHVIVVEGQVFTANTGDGASHILERVRKERPGVIPAVTYIPDADFLLRFGTFLAL